MEIIKNENELVIKVSKDSYMYNALTTKGDVKAYLEYLIDVEHALNGNESGLLLGHECTSIYLSKIKSYTKDELKKEYKECLDAIRSEIEYMKNYIGNDYVEAFLSEDGIISIDENASFHTMNVFFERLVAISELLDKGGN